MKLVRTIMIVAFAALLTGTFATAQSGEGKPDAPKGKGPGGGPGAMLDNLLPPHALDELKLTADQKTKYDGLQAAFKKELDAWKSAHPNAADQMRKAREDGDRDALHKLAEERKPVMDARKAGFDALVIEDATRGIDAGGSMAKAWQEMLGAGVKRIQSADVAV